MPGGDEVGIVVDEGKDIGSSGNMCCIAVYFPSTGEVIYHQKGA